MVSQSKREYLVRIKDRYRHVGRKGKSRILDEFCAVCGYHRKHAIRLLASDGRRRRRTPGRRLVDLAQEPGTISRSCGLWD